MDLKGQGARRQETNLGDVLADILRTETGADLAVLNGGGIRTDIPQGPIQVKTVMDVLPFNNFPVVLRLSGREIREVLEQGVSDLGGHGGKFLQVSGVRLVYRPSAPPGNRVQEIRINDQPLDPDKQYLLATNDFLAAGGDGFSVFKKAFPDQASNPDWKTRTRIRKGRPIRSGENDSGIGDRFHKKTEKGDGLYGWPDPEPGVIMKAWVNNQRVDLLEGMTVRHALIQADLVKEIEKGKKVYDEWGNEAGLDGAVEEGQRFEVK